MKFTSGKVAILFFLLTELIAYSHNNLATSFLKYTNNTYKKMQVLYKKKDNNIKSGHLPAAKSKKKPKLNDSADDDNSVWSNAFNFNKLLGSEVDPQTGNFFAFFKAGTLRGNLGHGPNINLKLNYHSNTKGDPDGIGYGWSWNLTHFNLTTNQLTTAYGQSFYLENHGKNNWEPRYHKLKDIKITGDKSTNFVISYANGIRETLSHQGYITQMEQQDGWSVHFIYKQGTHLLKTVVDDLGNKISLVRRQGYLFVTSHSSNGQPLIVRISAQDHQVRKLALLSKNNQQILPETYINYTNNNLISSVQYPSGIKKTVTYNCTQAMKFYSYDHLAEMCVVTHESVSSRGEQSEQTINYEYSASDEDQHNYLGYNSGLPHLPGAKQDILFEAPANYTYHTVKDNGLTKEVQTWNKYHLLTNVRVISDHTGHLLSEVKNFFCDTNTSNDCAHTSFRDLPVTYSLPLKIITRTWGDNTDSAATDIETKTYDNHGRLTQHTDSYGRTTDINYCPVTGDDSGCPALSSKWSLSAWPKSVAVYPASPSKLPPVVTYYSYHKFPDFNGKDYTLVLDHKTIKSKDQQVTLNNHYYQDPVNALTYGQLKQTILTGKAEQDAAKTSIVHNFLYIKNSAENSQTVYSSVVLDKDKSQQLPAITTSLFTHQVLQRTDASRQNITRYHYDLLGRLIQTDTAVGTAFAASVHYKYIRTAEENQVLITAANGLQHKIIFDNFGRPVMRFDESISAKGVRQPDQWRLTKKVDYDRYGRIKSKIAYLLDKNNKSIPLVTTKEYDDRGRILYSYLPDGETAVTIYDSPDRCIVSYSMDSHGIRSPLTAIGDNSLNKPVWKQIFPASSASLPDIKALCKIDDQQTNVKRYFTNYDGFGRIVMTKDPLGHIVKKHYDYMGNVVSVTGPDNTIHLQYNLTGQVTARWAFPASGGKYLLSSAGYNAAGQTVWKAGEDGKKTWFTYTPSDQVATAVTPAGHTISTKYNVLGLPVAKYVDNKLLQTTGYDHITALPVIKNDVTGTTKVTYSIDNLPLQLVHKGKNNYPDYHLSWQYDNNRRVISFFNIAGDQTHTAYDNLGRIAALYYQSHTGKEETLSIPVYDGFSRIFSIKYGSGMRRKITYDSWGRKNQITDTLGNKLLTSWNLSYDANDNITTLVKQADNHQQAILKYQYDNLDNLVTMDCKGSAGLPFCPRDTATGGSQINNIPVIVHQHYTFTPLNRLAQVREVLQNSETGKTLDKVVTYEYSDKNAPLRLQQISTQWNNKTAISHKFSYDIAGNMITDGEGNHITYNPFNQITNIVKPDGQQGSYTYNGNGKEVSNKNSSGTHYLFYSGNQLINEQIDSPEQQTHIIGYQGVAKAIDGVIYQYDESNYKKDVTATLTKISNSSDVYQLSQRTVYSPYGMRWSSKPAAVTLYQYNLTGFDGERTDLLTGWQFLGAGHRTYNPKLRNFVSEDPAGDGYAFGSNNPVMKTDPDGNMPKWLGKVFKYMGYVTSFGAKTSSSRLLKIVGSAAASAFIILASCGTLAVMTAPGMILNGIPYCLSTTAGAAPANKPLNIAASVTGAVQMIVFAAANIALLGYSAFSAFCATAEIGTALEAAGVEEIEMNTLRRATEVEVNARLFQDSITPLLQRREGLDWIAIRCDDDVTNTLNKINVIYGYNSITRVAGIALIAARRTARQISLSAMQRLLSESNPGIPSYIADIPDTLDESLLTDMFTPLSQGAELLDGATVIENMGTIFSNQEDLLLLQSANKVVLARWVSGSFSDGEDNVNLVTYGVNISGEIQEQQGTLKNILFPFRLREGEFMINKYYRL